jgi:hypothetical protein
MAAQTSPGDTRWLALSYDGEWKMPLRMWPSCANALVVGDGSETKLNPPAFLALHVMVA